MPQFSPNESKIAIAPITVQPSGLSCEAELFLGPDSMTKVATSGRIPFTSAGSSQNIRLPITMPPVGTYKVFLDVYVGGMLLLAYIGIGDVTITADTTLEVFYSSRINSCLRADIYNRLGNTWHRGDPSMLYPDIPDEKIVYRLVGDKILIFPAWGSWPIIYWQARGPYQAVIIPGVHRFDAATGKFNGVQLVEAAAVANLARIRGKCISVASGYQVTQDGFSYIIGQAAVVQIDSYEDVSGYYSIGAFLAPQMAFAGLSGWPYWNVPYGYPYIPAGQQVFIEADVAWAYQYAGSQRTIYLRLVGAIRQI